MAKVAPGTTSNTFVVTGVGAETAQVAVTSSAATTAALFYVSVSSPASNTFTVSLPAQQGQAIAFGAVAGSTITGGGVTFPVAPTGNPYPAGTVVAVTVTGGVPTGFGLTGPANQPAARGSKTLKGTSRNQLRDNPFGGSKWLSNPPKNALYKTLPDRAHCRAVCRAQCGAHSSGRCQAIRARPPSPTPSRLRHGQHPQASRPRPRNDETRAWTGNLGVSSNSTGWARAKRVHQESPEEGQSKEQRGKQERYGPDTWVTDQTGDMG